MGEYRLDQKVLQEKDLPPEFYEPLTPSGCPRSLHLELTLGLGRFDSINCPKCGQEVFRP